MFLDLRVVRYLARQAVRSARSQVQCLQNKQGQRTQGRKGSNRLRRELQRLDLPHACLDETFEELHVERGGGF
jgi:hypothetical protein